VIPGSTESIRCTTRVGLARPTMGAAPTMPSRMRRRQAPSGSIRMQRPDVTTEASGKTSPGCKPGARAGERVVKCPSAADAVSCGPRVRILRRYRPSKPSEPSIIARRRELLIL
jgi:hypothetical protein